MDVIIAYDTSIGVESRFTPDLLGEILSDHIPRFMGWVSVPDEDDPMGERWTPEWFDISEAIAELDKALDSGILHGVEMDGFTEEDLREEVESLKAELIEASNHTSRFHLSVY